MSHDMASKAVKNFLLNGGRLAITMGATVCTSAMIARRLGAIDMGVYGYAMWIVGTLGIFANIGLPSALTKYISEYLGSNDIVTAVRVGKGLLLVQLAVAAGVSCITVCFMLLKSPYRSIIGLAAVLLFFQALQQSLSAALAGIQRFDRLALTSLYVALASVASVGVAALLHAGVMGMLWATLTGLVVAMCLYLRDVNRYLLKAPRNPLPPVAATPDPFRRIRKFSLTVSYILLVDAIVWQRSEILFLKAYSTIAEIGFYTLAYSIASKMSDITSTFSTTLMPLYSESYGRDGLRNVGLVFVNALKYLQMLVVPLCLGGVALARPLTQLLFGAQFLSVALPLQVLLLSMSFTSIGVVISPLLYGIDKQSFIAKYGTAVAVLNIALDLILIPKYAAVGAALANCTAQIAGIVGGALYVFHCVRISFPWKTTVVIYLAAAVAIAPVAYFARGDHRGIVLLSGSVLFAAAAYMLLLVAVGELGKQDLDILKKALLTRGPGPKGLEVVGPA
jgi:O-antigen/teichoic acid export membrane protein